MSTWPNECNQSPSSTSTLYQKVDFDDELGSAEYPDDEDL